MFKWLLTQRTVAFGLALAGIIALGWAWQAKMRAVGHRDGRLSDPIQRGSIVESVYGIGTVAANRRYQLRPGTTTTIHDVLVKEGEAVAPGQPLVELEQGARFTAPFRGTVTWLQVKVGENVFPQTVVLELVDLLDRYLVVSLEQRAAIRVRPGQRARLSFEMMRDTSCEGTVESVYSRDSTFLVRIDAPDLPSQILPGMTADVAIGIGEPREALLVPVAAIEQGRVRVARGAAAPVPMEITTGLVDGAFAEVTSGELRPGDRLVLPKAAPP
jgi:multidrug efflux pump subunit AcrA (membrane-fusion protein)